jgi:lipid A 4'-phosphatase
MQAEIPFDQHASRRETMIAALVACAAGLLAGLAFMLFPALDIAISQSFLTENGKFWMARSDFWQGLRELFMRAFTLWYVVMILAGVLAARLRKPVLNLDWQRWLYLGVCSLIGPLLLVNIMLKEMWGRWRPREIIELGGQESFTSVLNTAGSCASNCSFVSGEVASMVMIFMALAFATRHWRPIHYGLAVLLGALEAYIRVGQGGHFTSDAIFAGVLMALVACAVHAWFFLSAWSPLPRLERRLGGNSIS